MRRYCVLPVIAMNLAMSTASGGTLGFEEDALLSEPSAAQITLTGMAQSQDRIEGRVELMVPLDVDWLNSESLDSYGIVTGRAGKQGWQVGAGGGIRVTVEEDTTVGGYGIVEHQRSTLGHGFWRLSPGLELQWGPWRLSTNAYLPMGQNEVLLGGVFDPSTLEFSEFKGHTGTLKTPLSIEELKETGIKGVDIVGSWQINAPLRVSVGGYYLTHEAEALAGIVAGAGYQVQPGVTLEVQGRRDAKEAELRAQVSIQFGNLTPDHKGHALQRVGADWATPVTVMSKSEITTALENLYFYKEGGTGSACTAETPCGVIAQETVDQMPQHSILLLSKSSNSYHHKVSKGGQPTYTLTFKNSQSLLGRGVDFKSRITNNEDAKKAYFQSSLKIQGGVGSIVDYIAFDANKNENSNYGLWIHQAHQVRVNRVLLNSNNIANFPRKTGIKIDSSTNVSVRDSSIKSNEIGAEVIKSREVEINGNNFGIFLGSANTGLLIDANTTGLKVNNNNFNMKSHSGADFSAMSHINGTERIAKDNKFSLGYLLPQDAQKGKITTNRGGSNDRQIADGEKSFQDQWNNSFSRTDIVQQPSASSFIGQLWGKISGTDPAVTQIK